MSGPPRPGHGDADRGGVYDRTPTAAEIHWQRLGLCREDPQKWTPDPPQVEAKSQEAKKVCLGIDGHGPCPVLDQCRSWALEHREQYGVWGGMTEEEREAYWRGRRRARRDHRWAIQFYSPDTPLPPPRKSRRRSA